MTGAMRAVAVPALLLAACSFEKDEFQLGQAPDADDGTDPSDAPEAEEDGPPGVDGRGLLDAPRTADARVDECDVAAVLACGANHVGDTSSEPSARSETDDYPSCVSWDETGPELVYAFTAAASGQVTLKLSDLPPREDDPPVNDVDVFVLEGECEASACMTYGDITTSFNAVAGRTYYLSVDGFMGAAGAYLLTLTCP